MNDLPGELDAALDACMDAALISDQWDDALAPLASALNLVGCSLNTYGASSRLALPATAAYREMLIDFVGEGWSSQDLRASRGWPLAAAGAVAIVEDMVSTEEERRSLPFYSEFLERRDMPILAGIGFKIGDQTWSLSGARSSRQGMPSSDERALLEWTQPHLRRIVRLAIMMAESRRRGAMDALGAVGEAAVCVDRWGRAVQLTGAAEALMGNGVHVRNARLRFDDVEAEHAVNQLIKAALEPDARFSATTRSVAARRTYRRPLAIEVIPEREALRDPLGLSGAIILLRDLDQPRLCDTERLRKAFCFSEREAQVAAMIGAGLTTDEIAQRLDLMESSVLQLIKAALAKAEVGSRAELAGLVSRLRGMKDQ
ncbi:MAG TPA: helix-turn-helix transcriptional regulator [Vitreimonas sp.]|nr:helix-turn-helix transcriptional regulator [Vitreimonas sp.]